jgi:hypothetical protein
MEAQLAARTKISRVPCHISDSACGCAHPCGIGCQAPLSYQSSNMLSLCQPAARAIQVKCFVSGVLAPFFNGSG